MPNDPQTPAQPSSDPRAAGPVCERPADASVPLPRLLVVSGGKVVADVTARPEQERLATPDLIKALAADWVESMLVPGQGHTLPRSVGRILSATALRADLLSNAEPPALPPNWEHTEPAARQFSAWLANDSELATESKVDRASLDDQLNRAEYAQQLYTESFWFAEAADKARHGPLRALYDIIDNGLSQAATLLRRNTRTRTGVQLAWNLIKAPVEKRKETLRNNQHVAAEAVAKDRAKNAAHSPVPPPTDPNKKP